MSKLFQPILIFGVIWIFVILLYNLRLSDLLNQSIGAAWEFLGYIVLCFTSAYLLSFFLYKKVNTAISINILDEKYEKKLIKYSSIWLFMSLIEVVYSQGMPIIWILTGSSKTYADFGIPSVHGLLNALQLVLSLISYYLYKSTNKKKFLLITIGFIIWNLCIITRQVIVVMVIEIFMIYFFYSNSKLKLIRNLSFSAILFIVLFGIVGDIRTGGENFKLLAQPSTNWPVWLPSGFLWVYIYITTPLNNLLYNFTFKISNYNYMFPNTMSLLLPSILRNIIYEPNSYTISGNIVTEAFNVSSAFAAPYSDAGYKGIYLFSAFAGFAANITWWVDGVKRIFFRAIITQILILSIFFNHFFYLPVVFQFVWVMIFFKGHKYEPKI